MLREERFAAPLLWIGVGVFLIGVAVAFFGGEDLAMAGLAIQVAGAAVLALNAARSRREVLSSDEDSTEPRRRGQP